MSLSWWNPQDPADDIGSIEAPKSERDGEREDSNSNGTAATVPGSPSIVFLTRPIVVAKLAGEKTGLLPTLNR